MNEQLIINSNVDEQKMEKPKLFNRFLIKYSILFLFVGITIAVSAYINGTKEGTLLTDSPFIDALITLVVSLSIIGFSLNYYFLAPRRKRIEVLTSIEFKNLIALGFELNDRLDFVGRIENFNFVLHPMFDFDDKKAPKVNLFDFECHYHLDENDNIEELDEKWSEECKDDGIMFFDNSANILISYKRKFDFEEQTNLLLEKMKKYNLKTIAKEEFDTLLEERYKKNEKVFFK
jgi:hypothetical protein